MHVVHLTASTFFGGPERQMLGLAEHLPQGFHSTYISYPENGRCQEFITAVRAAGHAALPLAFDSPRLRDTVRELTHLLKSRAADVLLTHSFKPNVLGRIAARRAGIPVIAVSRGWTWENLKVRVYETVDRVNLRFMDHVVAVSEGQAERVRKAGVPRTRLSVIRNAARLGAFAKPDPEFRQRLRGYFPAEKVPTRIVVGAGRLSPEKGFDVMIEAAAKVLQAEPTTGVVIFGEGTERPKLEARLQELGIADRVKLPGFTDSLDRFLPWADLVVLPSYTEGLPNVALEASAAGVAVVATAVGGTPEVIADGESGFLVPSGQPELMSARILELLRNEPLRQAYGRGGRQRMEDQFTFAGQARHYLELFDRLRSQHKCCAA